MYGLYIRFRGNSFIVSIFALAAHEKHDDCDYINTLIRAAIDFQEQDNGEYVLPRSKILDILAA
ncbi:hypothetical protein [Acinetobacter lwoffii]|uniref:hypothetical protein n=1 Tax=Acinetobacter lwoffii TaxID=28090 RepID=UPI003BF70B36